MVGLRPSYVILRQFEIKLQIKRNEIFRAIFEYTGWKFTKPLRRILKIFVTLGLKIMILLGLKEVFETDILNVSVN